jgi:hypothetical protein
MGKSCKGLKKTRQASTYNVTWRPDLATVVAEEKQSVKMLSACLSFALVIRHAKRMRHIL